MPFTPKPGKFIKVVQTGSAGNWWSIAEFGAYGKEYSEIPKTDPYNNSSSGNWWSIHDLHMYGTGCGVDNGQNTIFIRPTDGANIMRARNPTGEGCKGFYGRGLLGHRVLLRPVRVQRGKRVHVSGLSVPAVLQPVVLRNSTTDVLGKRDRGEPARPGCPTGSGMSLPVWDY